MSGTPLTSGEVDALFLPLLGYKKLVLAVSGGADSAALLHLAVAWRHRSAGAPELCVATVDHGLRVGSAAEAATVGAWTAALGLLHHVRVWTGPKPASGIQAAARTARYDLLLDVALTATDATVTDATVTGATGADGRARTAVVTAHTADDQAETVLMRLARGSGVDGLAAIPPLGGYARRTPGGQRQAISIARPLLTVPRARLLATLTAAGIPFLDDPSNRDTRFERVRVREALSLLDGLGVSRSALARTAARARSAKIALDNAMERLASSAVSRLVEVVSAIDRERVGGEPDEIGVRLLRRVLARSGGGAAPAELSAVEDLFQRLFRSDVATVPACTLGGAIIETENRGGPDADRILVYREPDRGDGLPTMTIAPGRGALWDNRIWASVAEVDPAPAELGPLGCDWHSVWALSGLHGPPPIPGAALRGLPAFRRDGRIVAVPMLATHALSLGAVDAARHLAGPIGADGRPTLAAQIRGEPMSFVAEP